MLFAWCTAKLWRCFAVVLILSSSSQAAEGGRPAAARFSTSLCTPLLKRFSSLHLRGGSATAATAAASTRVPDLAATTVPEVPAAPPRNPQQELYQAAYEGDVALTLEVLELGADPNRMCDTDENMLHPNALHIAAFQGHADLVVNLVLKGADVNLANRHGYTALHFAALTGKLETCKKLVELGSNVGAKDRFGDQPVDRAEQAEAKKVKEFLEQTMTKQGVARAWEGYRIPNEIKEMVEDAEKFVSEIPKAVAAASTAGSDAGAPATSESADADFIPRFMLDDNGKILPQYSSVADLAYAKKTLLVKQGLAVPEFLKIIEMIQADDDEAVSELLKWTPGGTDPE